MIHGDNPFVDTPDRRDPVRRFRGRLAAPVTVVTAGPDNSMTGLTVSSLNVMEGEPGLVQLVVGPTTDLWSAIAETQRFVVHICKNDDRHLAEVFAGLRPSPGGMFAGVDLRASEWGPVIESLRDRAYCRLVDRVESGYSGIVTGAIEEIEVADLSDPLIYFRGGYRALS